MVSHQEVCVQCGQAHPDRLFGIRPAAGRGCPNVLMGAFPVLTPRAPNRATAAVRRALDADHGWGAGALESGAGDHPFARKPLRSSTPWPLPMEAEEFL
jgi:hypothetical protein